MHDISTLDLRRCHQRADLPADTANAPPARARADAGRSRARFLLRPTRYPGNSNGSSGTRKQPLFVAFSRNRSRSIIRLTTARIAAPGACPQITKSSA